MFDTLIYAQDLDDKALANMTYFGITHALIAPSPSSNQYVEPLIQNIKKLFDVEVPRLAQFNITAKVVLGAHEHALPERAHPKLWQVMAQLAHHPSCAAIGLFDHDPDNHSLVQEHLNLTQGTNLKILFKPSDIHTLNHCYKFMDTLEVQGIDKDKLIVLCNNPKYFTKMVQDHVKTIALIHDPLWQDHPLLALTQERVHNTRLMLASSASHSMRHPLILPKWLVDARAQLNDEPTLQAIASTHALDCFEMN